MCDALQPFVGIGPFRLGMSRLASRDLAGGQFDAFQQNVDAFDELGIHCHYDPNDLLEFIEVFEPCQPELDGIEILDRHLNTVLRELKRQGLVFDVALTDTIFLDAGLAFTVVFIPVKVSRARARLYCEG